MIMHYKTKLIVLLLLLFQVSIHAQNVTEIWGMTTSGGKGDAGTIFKLDENGEEHQVVFSFEKGEGKQPNRVEVCESDDGNIYGVLSKGGEYQKGVLFEYNTTSCQYHEKVSFDGFGNGEFPLTVFYCTETKSIYGVTFKGGQYNQGVLFEYQPGKDTLINRYDFNTTDGATPNSGLMRASNNHLYGYTRGGGVYDQGVIYEYDVSKQSYTKKYDFLNADNDGQTMGKFVEKSPGLLIGTMASYIDTDGIIYEYDIEANTFNILYEFKNNLVGETPFGLTVLTKGGKLYGTTVNGGKSGYGVLYAYDFEKDSAYILQELYGKDGQDCFGGVTQGENDHLYGMTFSGGNHNFGVLYEYDIESGVYDTKVHFKDSTGILTIGSLHLLQNGKIAGLMLGGGYNYQGTFFFYDPVPNEYEVQYHFNTYNYGAFPHGSLVQATNGKLYGMTKDGAWHGGTFFELDPITEKIVVKSRFNELNGGKPYGSFIQASDSHLYGLVWYGHDYEGKLIRYNIEKDTVETVYTFPSGGDVFQMKGDLMEANNGSIYGLSKDGQIFEFDKVTEEVLFHTASNEFQQNETFGSLVEGESGKLYLLQTDDDGFIVEFNTSNHTYTKKAMFGNELGSQPIGTLIKGNDTTFYGLTTAGGAHDDGTLFVYDTKNDVITKLYDFDSLNSGEIPLGSLLKIDNDYLYGMTSSGGTKGHGTIFQYHIEDKTFEKKVDFTGENGRQPTYGHLIKVGSCIPNFNSIAVKSCDTYTSPSGKVWTTSGQYVDTISNECGQDSILTIDLQIKKVQADISMKTSTTLQAEATLVSITDQPTYQWLFCDEPVEEIVNENEDTLDLTTDGSYAVKISAEGCVDTSDCFDYIKLSIKKAGNYKVSIFPNPSTGYFQLDLIENTENLSYQLYDVTGKKVKEKIIGTTHSFQTNIHEKPGVYWLHLYTSDSFITTLKLILL